MSFHPRKTQVTPERLRALLHYDPATGVFTRLVWVSHNTQVGDVAGGYDNLGYLRIWIDNRSYYAHRLAFLYMHGAWPKDQIDHINGVRDDNRLANLRDVTYAVNRQNLRAANRDNKLGLLGVRRNKRGKFEAAIKLEGRWKYLGTFSTPELAHAAYLTAKRAIHPGCTI